MKIKAKMTATTAIDTLVKETQQLRRWRKLSGMARKLSSAARASLRRPRGLRWHLVALVLVALAPSLILNTLNGLGTIQALTDVYGNSLSASADSAAETLDREVRTALTASAILARSPVSGSGADLASFATEADLVGRQLGASISLWDPNDTAVLWVTSAGRASHLDETAGWAMRTAASGLSSVVTADVPSSSLMIYQPVAGAADTSPVPHPSRVLRVALGPSMIGDILSAADRAGASGTLLANADGRVLFRSTGLTEPVATSLARRLVTEHRAGPVSIEGSDGVRWLAARAQVPTVPGVQVAVFLSDADARALTRGPTLKIFGIALLSIVLATAAAIFLGARLARPLRRLTEASQAVAGGAESLGNVPQSIVTEFEALHTSLLRAERVMRRRTAAERLALTEARTGHELLSSVVNATADQIYVKDLDLRYVLANKATLLLPFLSRDEWQVLGRRVTEIVSAPDARAGEELDRQVIATGEVRRKRLTWRRPDGVVGTFALTKTPWRDAAGAMAGVVTVVHDVTDHRIAEQRLAGVQGELLRATRLSAMGAMASGLAHELNQPLAAATNFLNAAVRLLSRDPQDPKLLALARGAVADAVVQTLRAGAIVRRLREFVGRGEADLKVDDMSSLIREICEVARADGATRASALVVKVQDDPLLALVDRTQLQQVLLNLIRNAAEAINDAPGGRIEVSASRAASAGIEIIVSDNGPGLAPEIVDRLFQPFASTKALGMGIGLAICRTIAEGHGGTLTAGSNPGGGARFCIVLPPTTHLDDMSSERSPQS